MKSDVVLKFAIVGIRDLVVGERAFVSARRAP